jgi:hypothetical protein
MTTEATPTRPATETDMLVLVPGQFSASLDFRNATALAGCTKVEVADDGQLSIVRKWPQLSSGEEKLWGVLAWLNGKASYPDLADLRVSLDVANYAAVVATVGGL